MRQTGRLAVEQDFWDRTYLDWNVARLPADLRDLGLLYELEPWLYESAFLFQALGDVAGRRVLSIGGGIDGTALWMAQHGASVCCLDLSADAMRHTADLADRLGLADHVTCRVGTCETMTAHAEFDVVWCRKVLHHLSLGPALRAIHHALVPSGRLLAHEPVCLSAWLARVQARLPFHPNYPVMDDERVLTAADLATVSETFPRVEVAYFGLVTRPSLAYLIDVARLRRLLHPLGQVDHAALRVCPPLRALCSHVVITAVRDVA
jgi:SAM-dependent methyltransferase